MLNIPQHLFRNSFQKTFKYMAGTDAFLLSELVESELKFVPNHVSSAEAILCMHQMFCTSAFPFSACFYNSPRLLFLGGGAGVVGANCASCRCLPQLFLRPGSWCTLKHTVLLPLTQNVIMEISTRAHPHPSQKRTWLSSSKKKKVAKKNKINV